MKKSRMLKDLQKCLVLLAYMNFVWFFQTVNLTTSDTLRMIQIVHTHGDRIPSHFVHNDPFSSINKFWPEGIGQLNKFGKSQMYEVGIFFAEKYKHFLRKYRTTFKERFIKVQSSGSRRCLQSGMALVAGLMKEEINEATTYDLEVTMNFTYENLNKYWTPIPITSVFPKGSGYLLDLDPSCPNLDREIKRMNKLDPRIKQVLLENDKFFHEMSFYTGELIQTLKQINSLLEELEIESQSGYNWSDYPYFIWSEDYNTYVMNQLRNLSRYYWILQYDNQLIQRLVVGELIKTLNENIRNYANGTNRLTKVFVYSTHDSKIVALQQALNLTKNFLPSLAPGTSIVFELHYDQENFHVHVSVYDQFDREQKQPVLMKTIPLQDYIRDMISSDLETTDILYECGIKIRQVFLDINILLLWTDLAIAIFILYLFIKYRLVAIDCFIK